MLLWNSFSADLKRRFGQKVQKIPLDVGSTCPNRDGTLSVTGCTFCNAHGSGSGLGLAGMNVFSQWKHWHTHFRHSSGIELFIAYMQSFSNTYGPTSRLRTLVKNLEHLPDCVGFSFGTRPDCVDREKALVLAETPFDVQWLELGVQTFDNTALQAINRGHDAACSVKAIECCAKAGLSVCVHLMAGLPQAAPNDLIQSVHRINNLPVHGVKFHNLFVCKRTPLAYDFLEGRYKPLQRETYLEQIVEALSLLRSDIQVHRVVADPQRDDLLAPQWPLQKHKNVLEIERRMRAKAKRL